MLMVACVGHAFSARLISCPRRTGRYVHSRTLHEGWANRGVAARSYGLGNLFRRVELHPSCLLFKTSNVLDVADWLRLAMDLSYVLGMFAFTKTGGLLWGLLEIVLQYLGLGEVSKVVWAIDGVFPRWRKPFWVNGTDAGHERDRSFHLR